MSQVFNPSRRALVCLGALGLMSRSILSHGAPVVKLIVPFPAGGAADFMGRTLARALESELNAPIVVENRVGGNARIALHALQAAPADGLTVALVPDSLVWLAPTLYETPPYGADSFIPISDVAQMEYGIAVATDSPHTTLESLVSAWKKSEDDAIGVPALGSMIHFLISDFIQKTGTRARIVPYQGAAPMLNDLWGGHVPSISDSTISFIQHHQARKLRVLGVASARRSAHLPDVPTFVESGYPDSIISGRYVLWAHKDTKADDLTRWNIALRKVLARSDVSDPLSKMGFVMSGGTSSQEAVEISEKMAKRWLPIVKGSGFKF